MDAKGLKVKYRDQSVLVVPFGGIDLGKPEKPEPAPKAAKEKAPKGEAKPSTNGDGKEEEIDLMDLAGMEGDDPTPEELERRKAEIDEEKGREPVKPTRPIRRPVVPAASDN
jgi:hypothetical protein